MLPQFQTASRYAGVFFQQTSNTRSLLVFGGLLGGFIVAIAILNFVSNRMGGKIGGKKGGKGAHYNRRLFRKEATALGLAKKQIKTLEGMIRTYSVRRPYDLLKNSRTLNNTLGKAIRDASHMEAPPSVIESRKYELFQIKQMLERMEPANVFLSHTKEIQLGQRITIEQEGGKRFNSLVTANLKEFYCVKVPTNAYGEAIRWKKGTKINIFVWNKGGDEVHFISKIIGYNSVKKITSIILQHTKRESRANLRRFRRKKIQKPVYIYPIRIVEKNDGRRTKKEAVVERSNGRMGNLVDLSAGGCCLNMTRPLKKGDLCKLNFEPIPGNPVSTFGKTVDIQQTSRIRYNVHIMFTRASSKNLNRINEFIYDFA
ncbi:MAG: PilZ domain-containing protein [Spirochaetales bacterium]|nr:PilZ domain-containing protein [Spirochaetales bacterium]